MKRRNALLLPLALGTAPLVRPQTSARSYKIGYMGVTASHAPAELPDWNGFIQRLSELGYHRGANLTVDERYVQSARERYADFAADMIRARADAVVVTSATMARYVMGLSRTMPIVALSIAEPVRSGLVGSLAHPGGQLTGFSDLSDELLPKQMELLKAAVPAARRIAYASCPFCAWSAGMGRAESRARHAELEKTAQALGVTLVPADLSDVNLFDGTAAVLLRERADALLIKADVINVLVRDQWLAFAARHRLPTLAPYRGFGAMLSYGPDFGAIFRRAAELVARILGGAVPGDLPMEQPARLRFVVDLKVANSVGLTVPKDVLLRADEVVQ